MKLTCHCGEIELEVNEKPKTLTSCNCSICNRYGALWGYYKPDEVLISSNKMLSSYKWSDENIEFMYCGNCGCVTHYVTIEKIEKPIVAVNFRMANPEAIKDITIRNFDGAVSWKYLD